MSEAPGTPTAAELQVSVQYRLIEALQEREHQLAEAQRLAHMGSWVWDLVTGEVTCSDELHRIFGRAPGGPPMDHESFLSTVRSDFVDEVDRLTRRVLEGGGDCTFSCPIQSAGEGERWVRVSLRVERDEGVAGHRMNGVVQDITELRQAEHALEELDALLNAIAESASDIFSIVERDGTIRFTSPSSERLLGYRRGSRRGSSLQELVHPDDLPAARSTFRALVDAGEEGTATFEVRLAHADGSWRLFESAGRNLLGDPAVRGLLFTIRDITDRKQLEDRLAHEILHDPLTGLPNRELLTGLALGAMARASRRTWVTAVLVVDIDSFCDVNDEFGFDAGDQVLVELARRLDAAFREEDGVARGGSVGRFAGDEFLVLCEEADRGTALAALSERIALIFAAPIEVEGHSIRVTASTGIALAPPGSNDFDALLHGAESASRTVKARGGNGTALFDADRGDAARFEAKRRLQQSLEEGELRLFYQPKVSLATEEIIGAEALLRWEHPTRGLVPPLDFIPLAEETGLIVPIGAWVVEEACRQASLWRSAFPDRPPFLMCVNVSARQFDAQLVQTVAKALQTSGLPAGSLGLEVTESILMVDVQQAVAILADLDRLGVTLSIDDFGTGYSSLAYLKTFDLHELKIDKSFVDGLGADANDSAIVAAVVAVAHALGLGVIAEGVETYEQVERLRSLGCEVAQGYYFSRPVKATEFEELMRDEATASWRVRGLEAAAVGDVVPYRASRVLVVDDSPEIRQLARISLAAVGFEVHEAANGRLGVDAARELEPDCILLDVMMPELGGMDACRTLREDPATANCTIIMLTANADASDKVEAFSHGADDYIIKPFSPRDLSTRVQAAMQRRA